MWILSWVCFCFVFVSSAHFYLLTYLEDYICTDTVLVFLLSFRCFFLILTFFFFYMSAKEEVEAIISGEIQDPSARDKGTIDNALREVQNLLTATGTSLQAICKEVEVAASKAALQQALKPFNGLVGIFLGLTLSPESYVEVKESLVALGASPRLTTFLEAESVLNVAITNYKSFIIEQLAAGIRRREDQRRLAHEIDEELFSQILPDPTSPDSEGISPVHVKARVEAKKRPSSELEVISRIPKKSRIPALASVELVSGEGSDVTTPKKKVLMTRERLRRSMHDPRGLLDLTASSTNALERTKKLELLKNAGFGFNTQGSKSFSDKLNAAILRLDLGLGGHSVGDSLLFGAKVLSSPASLTAKQISNVENNLVDSNTTWKHQDAYVKRMIAGSINQAKRIFEKYDEILHGPAPEILISKTHSAITDLLGSESGRSFNALKDSTEASAIEKRDTFIKKIIEAVSPIIPITLRNKSLDGGYFRSALYMLGAAELLFKQYESDIRVQANPAGAVGMCTAMHALLERAAIYDEGLKDLGEFMQDMRTQYQTSFGLGESFAHDSRRTRRRMRTQRNPSWQDTRIQPRGSGFDTTSSTGFNQAYSSSRGRGRGALAYRGRGAGVPIADLRARGECYDFRAGQCRRGASCRYHHSI